jgi:hypothetical protein
MRRSSRARRSRLADLQRDFARGRWDVRFFARRFLGVDLHPGQVRMARNYLKRNKTGWRALYLWLIIAAGNRAGKTMGLSVIIVHACVYKMGLKPPRDGSEAAIKTWRGLPFMWFHFAVQQEIAELVYTEIVNLLSGTHPAQKEGLCPLSEEFGGAANVATWDKKYNGDYRWIVFSELLGGAEVHFRTTGEKGIGSLGRDMHGISFDEVGFEKNLDFILNEVLHLRRLGTGGQLILISTPSEDIGPSFADLWYTGDPDSMDRLPGRLSMRMSTRDNIGYGLDQEVFDALVADITDPNIVLQNIDGYFIQGKSAYFNAVSVDSAFVDWLPERAPARMRHNYAQGVDPALRHDSAWSLVFDILIHKETGQPIAVGVYADRKRGKLTTPTLVALAATPHNSYDNPRLGSSCSTAIDATGFGGKMFKEALEQEVPTVRSIEFGGSIQKKRKLLGDLRTMLDEGRLFFPRHGIWMQVRRQLLGYKIEDRSIEQDAVMAAACGIAEVRRNAGAGDPSLPFDYHTTAEELPQSDGRRWSRQPYAHTRPAS